MHGLLVTFRWTETRSVASDFGITGLLEFFVGFGTALTSLRFASASKRSAS
jgi:hypothetical protein